MHLSARFDQALQYAVIIHAHQERKVTGIPYVAHLLGVASIALEHGANEDEAIGALLHDAGEDAGGQGRIDDVRHRFGDAVADIVQGCSDALTTPKPEWRPRKEKYVAHLAKASASVRLVVAADKLYNARTMLRDLRRFGDALWSKFKSDKAGQLWYFRAIVTALQQGGKNDLVGELDTVVSQIEAEAASSSATKRA